MKTATATNVSLATWQGQAAHYKLSEPLSGNEYVVVSAVDIATRFPGYDDPRSMQIETYIFAADETGEVLGWGELPGSMKGTLDHAEALREAGYEVSA